MKTTKRTTGRWFYGTAAVLALALSGCGGRTGEVSGTVRFGGRPLSTGWVSFASQTKAGIVVSSLIREDGGYEVADCPLGPAKIAVKITAPHGGRGPVGAKAVPGGVPEIPARYANADKSGLDYTVLPGRQRYDIRLGP